MSMDVSLRYARLEDPADRFSEAVALEPGDEAAAGDGPAAFPQRPGALDALLGPALAEPQRREDAFTVRIQAPEGTTPDAGLPVLVFIPGGGFLSGSPDARWFTGPAVGEAVVVTLGYRLGVLGHLHPDGQAEHDDVVAASQRPLRDLVTGLRWVARHIAGFGGDPERITLAGDSAGAWYAWALAAHPEARDLIRRLALVSLPYEPPLSEEGLLARRAAVVEALRAAGELGPHDTDLHEVSTEALLDAQAAMAGRFKGKGMPIMPAGGGAVPVHLHEFDQQARHLAVSDLALFSTRDEAAAFLLGAPDEAFPAPAVRAFVGGRFELPDLATGLVEQTGGRRAMAAALTLHQFSLSALEVADAAARAGVRVHLARLTVDCGLPGVGSPHCFGLPFLFGNPERWSDAPMLQGVDAGTVRATAAEASAWLAGFVADGAPRTAAGEELPAFDPARPEHQVFDGGAARAERPAELALLHTARR